MRISPKFKIFLFHSPPVTKNTNNYYYNTPNMLFAATTKRICTKISAGTAMRATRQISSRNFGRSHRDVLSNSARPVATMGSKHKVVPQYPLRWLSSSESSLSPEQIQVRLNEFQELFVEARMCIDDVKDSVGTHYFEDDAEDARVAVEAAVSHFVPLLQV